MYSSDGMMTPEARKLRTSTPPPPLPLSARSSSTPPRLLTLQTAGLGILSRSPLLE